MPVRCTLGVFLSLTSTLFMMYDEDGFLNHHKVRSVPQQVLDGDQDYIMYEHGPARDACVAFLVLYINGEMLVFGSLFAKMYRIFKVAFVSQDKMVRNSVCSGRYSSSESR